MDLDDRFWSKVKYAEALDCWIWTACVNERGYGQFTLPQRRSPSRAHRVAWELLRGEIPDGLVLDHLCRVRSCVNPWHVEPVTPAVNTRRKQYAARAACKRGHLYTAESSYFNGRQMVCRTCRRVSMLARRARHEAQS